MDDAKRDANIYWFEGERERIWGHATRAMLYYEKALEIDPEHKYAIIAHGREFYVHMQAWVISSLARADRTPGFTLIERNPRHAVAHYKRGVWDETRGAYDEAISHYTKAIEMKPKYVCAYHRRGVVYKTLGKYDEAISDYTKAIEIGPKCAMYYVRRGCVYCSKGELDKAILEFNTAIEIDPKDAWVYYNRGRTHSDKGKYDCAVSDYSKAVELYPKYIAYYLKEDYVRLRDDVHKAEEMGYQVNPMFLKALREASRREE